MTNYINVTDKALVFATTAHNGQVRKATNISFMVGHVIEVGLLISKMTSNSKSIDNVATAAGFLHDVVEDTTVTIEEIESEFGAEIANLVTLQSEDKSKTWQERKDHTMELLKTNENKQLEICILADKLSNMRSLAKEASVSQDFWSKFNAPKEKQEWYYNEIAKQMKFVTDLDEYKEYKELLKKAFA